MFRCILSFARKIKQFDEEVFFFILRTCDLYDGTNVALGTARPRNRHDRDGSSYASNVSVHRHIIMAIKGRLANCADLNILVSAMHHADEARHEERRRVRA